MNEVATTQEPESRIVDQLQAIQDFFGQFSEDYHGQFGGGQFQLDMVDSCPERFGFEPARIAVDMLPYFERLGFVISKEEITRFRDQNRQRSLGIPEGMNHRWDSYIFSLKTEKPVTEIDEIAGGLESALDGPAFLDYNDHRIRPNGTGILPNLSSLGYTITYRLGELEIPRTGRYLIAEDGNSSFSWELLPGRMVLFSHGENYPESS